MQRATVNLPGEYFRFHHNRAKRSKPPPPSSFQSHHPVLPPKHYLHSPPPLLPLSPVPGLLAVYSSRWEGVWSALCGLFADKQSFEGRLTLSHAGCWKRRGHGARCFDWSRASSPRRVRGGGCENMCVMLGLWYV